jgi:Holliday junction resolvase RusA-like endonuclease
MVAVGVRVMPLPVMTVLVDVVVPGDPCPAARPRMGQGRVYMPKRYVEAKEDLQRFLFTDLVKRGSPRRYEGPVRVDLWFSVLRAGDLDNYAKTVLDALNDLVIKDDRQVVDLHARLVAGSPTGVHVVVETTGV